MHKVRYRPNGEDAQAHQVHYDKDGARFLTNFDIGLVETHERAIDVYEKQEAEGDFVEDLKFSIREAHITSGMEDGATYSKVARSLYVKGKHTASTYWDIYAAVSDLRRVFTFKTEYESVVKDLMRQHRGPVRRFEIIPFIPTYDIHPSETVKQVRMRFIDDEKYGLRLLQAAQNHYIDFIVEPGEALAAKEKEMV